ncbi:hypothetical protein LO80_00710 [Candidatus Francisella endociliophora]|uniref:Chloroquine resistance protein n=1 Tax=Candidatus Francisella endociliophora TaxID=653937 RepID=A0A097EM39_9GAMM|nr:hypothetical protein [Francisella sp. FSC1006]AIT08639.1 hypothetical protein LO80_00710 [Francisella sp. FSC1006]
MNFENQLQEVFDIDLWELKEQYKPCKSESLVVAEEQKETQNEEAVIEPQLLYSNEKNSSKLINFFISDTLNINLYKNIAANLFFNSQINIFHSEIDPVLDKYKGINILEKDLIIKDTDLLSIQSKKNILSKLYEYADFAVK